MAKNSLIAFAQSRVDSTRREVRDAVIDFDVPDDKILELRETARQAFQELKELDRRAAKRGVTGFFKFW